MVHMDQPQNFRSGFIALIGRPNVGKSTLLNRLIGQKVAITSPVAQTTRRRLRGILTRQDAQLIFVDTPGIHKPHHLLGERLVNSARAAIAEVDVVLLLMHGAQPPGKGDAFIVDLLRQTNTPVHVALNQWDLNTPELAKRQLDSYRQLLLPDAGQGDVMPELWPMHAVSALTGQGTESLVEALAKAMPEGPCLYPADTISDQSEQVLLGELIREQVLLQTREEVPHSVAVQVERVIEQQRTGHGSGTQVAVLASILVERQSQKGILIGRGGKMLSSIGARARKEMEVLLASPVYLELFVKVVPHWRRNLARLNELGYGGDS